jgi:hypothetical protein
MGDGSKTETLVEMYYRGATAADMAEAVGSAKATVQARLTQLRQRAGVVCPGPAARRVIAQTRDDGAADLSIGTPSCLGTALVKAHRRGLIRLRVEVTEAGLAAMRLGPIPPDPTPR